MAGDWIKVRKALWDHPKIVRISSACNADKARTLGACIRLWSIADDHTVDGRLDGYTVEAVDAAVGVAGFANAAADAGWLTIEPQAVVIPRFEEHNGRSAKRRAQETERKNDARKASASDADKKRTREEKRRINKSIDREGDRSTESKDNKPAEGHAMYLDTATWNALLPQFKRVADLVRRGHNPLSEDDRDTIVRCVAVAATRLPAGELEAIIKRCRRAFSQERKGSPVGYFKSAVVKACADAGVDFHFAAKFDIPRPCNAHAEPAAAPLPERNGKEVTAA